MELDLVKLPQDGADYGCGRRVPIHTSRDGDGICRQPAQRAISFDLFFSGRVDDLMAFRAICPTHITELKAR